MRDGFVKTAVITPSLRVADPVYNREQIVKEMRKAARAGAKIIVFPELALTGATCGVLFAQDLLAERAETELRAVVKATERLDALVFVGTPWRCRGKLYNCLAGISGGELLGLAAKTCLSAAERAVFSEGPEESAYADYLDNEGDEVGISFGGKLQFVCDSLPELKAAALIGEELWSPKAPDSAHAQAGALVLVHASAQAAGVGKTEALKVQLEASSRRNHTAVLSAGAGSGESTTDLVFAGTRMIAENGRLLACGKAFTEGITYGEIDLGRLTADRQTSPLFGAQEEEYDTLSFDLKLTETVLTRVFPPHPFIPEGKAERAERCEEILTMQAAGLMKRLAHTGSKRAVVGISGGLDSTLALLVTVKAFDALKLPRKGICAITMPCFGTTDRTYTNACAMAKSTGAELREIPIAEAVRQHFADIGQDEGRHDAAYENAQARERTQVLMDVANQIGGLVVGTGDLSELALGWATYNGDHMSMYGVNGDIPKTLVRHLVAYMADTCGEESLSATLKDVLDTPVSPELLPPEEGQIAQKTEDLVGPYELHDFFLYYMLRFGFRPRKIYRMACRAFADAYEPQIIRKWLEVFTRRFFWQQYKRSCLPDGPKVGSVDLSPRGNWHMPSDAASAIWLAEIEGLERGGGKNIVLPLHPAD